MAKNKEKEGKRIAVVRVRGNVHMKKGMEDTFNTLNLTRENHCVVLDSKREILGMVKKVKDFVTWGEISSEVMEKLVRERGRLEGNKKISKEYLKENTSFKSVKGFVENFMGFKAELEDIKIKPVFRLNPPQKGYERKGIKEHYSQGGALGYRGKEINHLLKKMI